MTAPRVVTEANERQIRRTLARRDARLAVVMNQVGPCRLPASRTAHPFVSLVRALTSQQLSTKAAATIFGRVADLVGGTDRMTAARLLAVAPEALRAAGLSAQKVAYIRDLASRVADRRLDLPALDARTDDDVYAAITEVKGFGNWSADMFLMFQLGRADIFPVGDLGIVKGMQALLGMKRRPAVVTMLRAAESWRPYRSVAAWYLWRLIEMSPDARPDLTMPRQLEGRSGQRTGLARRIAVR